MKQESDWQAAVRAALRDDPGSSHEIEAELSDSLAQTVLDHGKPRLIAGAVLRLAATGAGVALLATLGAAQWAAREGSKIADVISSEVPWIP